VRAQLQRLLAHPLFTNSKRYPTLLSYTSSRPPGQRGGAQGTHHRIEAFGRKPTMTRMPTPSSASPPGRSASASSSITTIRARRRTRHRAIFGFLCSRLPRARIASPRAGGARGDAPDRARASSARRRGSARALRSRSRFWFRSAAAVILAGLIGVAIGRYRPTPPPSNIDRFWEPVVSSPSTVTYCLGEPAAAAAQQQALSRDAPIRLAGRLVLSDVLTLARTIVPLVARHGAFRVLPASETSFAQLAKVPSF